MRSEFAKVGLRGFDIFSYTVKVQNLRSFLYRTSVYQLSKFLTAVPFAMLKKFKKFKVKQLVSTKETQSNVLAKFLTGIRFYRPLRILSHEICKECLRVKCWRTEARVEEPRKRTTKMNQSIKTQNLSAKHWKATRFSSSCFHKNWNYPTPITEQQIHSYVMTAVINMQRLITKQL